MLASVLFTLCSFFGCSKTLPSFHFCLGASCDNSFRVGLMADGGKPSVFFLLRMS